MFAKREPWVQAWLHSGKMRHLETNLDFVAAANQAFRSGVRMTPADLQHPSLQGYDGPGALFTLLVAETHPLFSRSWNPSLWEATLRKAWEWRCGEPRWRRSPFQASNKALAAMIKTPLDLERFFVVISQVRLPLDPAFAATRPPYMSKVGPYADLPSTSEYYTLFEQLLESPSSEAIVTMTTAELQAIFGRCTHMPALQAAVPTLLVRWSYERARVWSRRRAYFKARLQESIIQEAMHPRRMMERLEAYGELPCY